MRYGDTFPFGNHCRFGERFRRTKSGYRETYKGNNETTQVIKYDGLIAQTAPKKKERIK